MFDLKAILNEISTKWNYKMEEISPGVFRMDVAIKMKDDTWRYQFVYIWIIAGRHHGKDVVYMNSRCGIYSPNLNMYSIMKDAGYCNLSSVTITTDKMGDGTPCETVIVQAGQPVETTTAAILNDVIFEVGNNADFIEQTYFGGDKN